MVSGDWPELEYLVIGTGVRVLHANEAAASVYAVIQELSEADSSLPEQPTAVDVSTFADRYAAQVAPLDAAATSLETEMAAIGSGHGRILDIVDADRDAAGVAEDTSEGAVSLGARAASLAEECAALSRSLEEVRRAVPPAGDAATGLASAMRRIVVALEPAVGWGDRSAAVLADWT